MFFSRVVLFAISLGALSVLATPHALHHHALHRRAVAARAASNETVTTKRQNSPKCRPPPSSSIPVPSPIVALPSIAPPPATTPKPSTSTLQNQPPATPATTSTATQPSTASGSPFGGFGGPFAGIGTFFATGLGACGLTNKADDSIVAVSQLVFDIFPGYDGVNPNTNPICNKKVTITGPNGATHSATITDRCTGCNVDDLDMTSSLFDRFADPAEGRIDITWSYS